MYYDGSHTVLYLTNESSTKCDILYVGKVQYPNDQRDKISVNNVIQQLIASGKHYCISLTKAPLNVKIGMMVKCITPMINIVIKSL